MHERRALLAGNRGVGWFLPGAERRERLSMTLPTMDAAAGQVNPGILPWRLLADAVGFPTYRLSPCGRELLGFVWRVCASGWRHRDRLRCRPEVELRPRLLAEQSRRRAARTGRRAYSERAYRAAIEELALLGLLALRQGPGRVRLARPVGVEAWASALPIDCRSTADQIPAQLQAAQAVNPGFAANGLTSYGLRLSTASTAPASPTEESPKASPMEGRRCRLRLVRGPELRREAERICDRVPGLIPPLLRALVDAKARGIAESEVLVCLRSASAPDVGNPVAYFRCIVRGRLSLLACTLGRSSSTPRSASPRSESFWRPEEIPEAELVPVEARVDRIRELRRVLEARHEA